MQDKDNYLHNAELSTEQNCNMIDGIPNNTTLQKDYTQLWGRVFAVLIMLILCGCSCQLLIGCFLKLL